MEVKDSGTNNHILTVAVMLWVDYCAYAIGLGDADKCRDIMTQATSLAGYHLTEGKLLWDLRLEYEMTLLQTMQVCFSPALNILCVRDTQVLCSSRALGQNVVRFS